MQTSQEVIKFALNMIRTWLSYLVNTMAADDLATPGARASADMVLT